ncbi:Superoxide dismutase [Ascochyta rabiei]|uniref:Superoxide dismutase n=1 Tax=Didymella rabiei TaxID=5454 RepID=UPI00220ECC6D|nr:Superoxide dismutase [Ascochyta rabiei]UPX18088.1 Superoxide dismutase [Ascochyta rabiei]
MTVLRCLARRPAATPFRAAASAASVCRAATRQTAAAPPPARSLYTVPTLANHDQLTANGVPGLFSKQAFRTAYTQYQQHIIDELNDSTAGTPFEGQDTKSLTIEFARDPTRAYGFNLASMAFNNHFFFRGLNTNPDVLSAPPSDLAIQIKRDFSSMDTLRATFLATAEAMFGPGFVWLVQTKDTELGSLRILPTYLAGSPLSGAHYRRQSHDLNTHNPDSYAAVNKVGKFGHAAQHDARPKKPLGGVDVVPLLCVNTWEHAWLHDYGVKGKAAYLRAWWDKIDWDVVRQGATISPVENRSNQFMYK